MSEQMDEEVPANQPRMPSQYAAESFTPDEAAILQRYFTNIDQPVFAVVNLPEAVKGALFARYSRSAKSLRRLFLDEFAGDVTGAASGSGGVAGDVGAATALARAERLYDKVLVEFGDDSVAQLGGAHLACEQASNLLTKVLERGRLMAYLEQSTRYISYSARLPTGRYRYYRDPEILASHLGARYIGDMDAIFDGYSSLLQDLQPYLSARFPKDPEDSDIVHRQALRAKAFDLARGLLPAATLSNVGMYGTGQAFENLLMRMRSHPLPEARFYADLMLSELRKVIPSYLGRVDDPARGERWSRYLSSTRAATASAAESALGPGPRGAGSGRRSATENDEHWHGDGGSQGPEVDLVDFDPDGEDKVIAAILYPVSNLSDAALAAAVRTMPAEEKAAVLRAYVGERGNRRHKPGRAFERTQYRFDVISDYGAFRDLQRHRMLTIEWQSLGTHLGYTVPDEIDDAELTGDYVRSLEVSRELHAALLPYFPDQAAYAVSFAFQVRYVMQMSAREAMHVIELRSSPQGHASYRWLVLRMLDLIATKAGHSHIASAMSFASPGDAGLGRLSEERRNAARRRGAALGRE